MATQITIHTRLHDGIYRSSGGGEDVTHYAWAPGSSNHIARPGTRSRRALRPGGWGSTVSRSTATTPARWAPRSTARSPAARPSRPARGAAGGRKEDAVHYIRCTYCNRAYDEYRRVGWAPGYCSPLCERRHAERRASAFARWWRGEKHEDTTSQSTARR